MHLKVTGEQLLRNGVGEPGSISFIAVYSNHVPPEPQLIQSITFTYSLLHLSLPQYLYALAFINSLLNYHANCGSFWFPVSYTVNLFFKSPCLRLKHTKLFLLGLLKILTKE